jgi:MarR family transcriptional regulator, negative regulator of the multidrug operon emrRAB
MNFARPANLLGALALAVGDLVTETTSRSAGSGASVPAALVTLHNSPGISVGELARVLGLSHAGTVRLVDRLAADGVVSRHRGSDGREVLLRLEPAGKRSARSVLAARAGVLEGALAALDPGELIVFERVVSALLASLSPTVDIADHTCRLCDDSACPRSTCPVEGAIAEQR